MFSGLVAAIGTVREVRRQGGGALLEVAWPDAGEPFVPGESIAVSGACLTVARVGADRFMAEVSPETLSRTTLGRLRGGQHVNLERSLRLADRLGGHLVLGHVDATARVAGIRPAGAFTVMRVALPPALAPEVAEKGSIAVDGISLTVSALAPDAFEVALIPTTLATTTLGERRPGDDVNLETDVLAKYVRRSLGGERPRLEELLGGLGHAQG